MPEPFLKPLVGLAVTLCMAFTARADEPVAPGAVHEAAQILDYISQLPARCDRRVISGQQIGFLGETGHLYESTVTQLHSVSSKWVSIIGVDYGYPQDMGTHSLKDNLAGTNRIIKDHWNAGGLALITFHANNPWTGGSAWEKRTGDLGEVITPGTPANEAWMKELDLAAQGLADLRDAGVIVLWRPFPDMNETSYWWGTREDEPFRRDAFVNLWKHMFNYFTVTKRLNNLLWVYSASSAAHKKMSVSAYFPGKEFCDVVGLDSYSSEIVWDGYNELVQLGKPFGITEFGPAPEDRGKFDYLALIDRIRLWYPQCAYFLAAAQGSSLAENRNAPRLMTDLWVISRDRLDWRAPGHRRWKQDEKLALNRIEVLTRDPVRWKRVDLRLDLTAAFDTPFDPDQIEVEARFTAPSGKIMTVPAFFDQPFERRILGNGKYTEEFMNEAGTPEWRVRFTPTEAGEYRVSAKARDRSGLVESNPIMFSVGDAHGPGYIRVSNVDTHYFEFDDGTPFFAIGLNIAEHPLSEYYRYIPRLAQSGGNFSRLWIGFDYFALERGLMGDYRLDNAWRLDQIVELSEQYGIYQKFCIDWIRHITPRGEPRKNFDREDYAYSTSNGGPCRNMRDFFTLPEARRLFRNRLRYIVARWGYSPNVMAWELWNEVDLVDPQARDAAILVPWNKEMCAYLKSIDPWGHLTTTSLSGREFAKTIWSLPENQFAQRHGYSTPRPDAVLASADMAGNVIQWLDDVANFNKPYLMAEFGLQRDRMDVRGVCDNDQGGAHMHDGLWAALAAGAAGTAQLWWWGQYVDPKDLYHQFTPVAKFVKGIDWTTAGFEKADVQSANENLRALGLRGRRLSVYWLQNKAHNWWNIVSKRPIPPVDRAEVTISGYTPGRYRVELWDPYLGEIVGTSETVVSGESFHLMIPKIEADIAVKVFAE